MLDTTTVTNFIKTFPAGKFPKAEFIFGVEFDNSSKMKKYSVALTRRGYLGTISLGREGGGMDNPPDIAIRLEPGKSIAESSIFEAAPYGHTTCATLLSPSFEYLITALLGHERKFLHRATNFVENFQELKDLASFLKDVTDLDGLMEQRESILSGADVSMSKEQRMLTSNVWKTGSKDNKFYTDLYKLAEYGSTEQADSLAAWVDEQVKNNSASMRVKRIYVANHYMKHVRKEEEFVDLSDLIKEQIEADDFYDAHYGLNGWATVGGFKFEALVLGVKWHLLQNTVANVDTDLWNAVIKYAEDPKKYTGEPHLEFAKKVAGTNPTLAYTHACNAAGFYSRIKRKPCKEAIEFAHKLATDNGWTDIAEVLGWSIK